MTFVAKLGAVMDDRINPITVKELRQAVQSHFVTVTLLIFLLVEFLAMMVAVLFTQPDLSLSANAGSQIFLTLDFIMLAICLTFVPIYAGIRLAAERSEQNVDLLFITTIKPAAVIRGKALTAMAVALLIFSVCLPFMVMTYLLRGIDLPAIYAVLLMDFAAVALGVCGALFIAAMPLRWPTKVFLAIALLAVMSGVFEACLNSAGYWIASAITMTWHFWIVGLLELTLAAVLGILLLLLAQAALTPAAANRARSIRIYGAILWAITGAACVALARIRVHGGASQLLGLWAGWTVALLAASLVASGCERDQWGPRLQQSIPRSVWLRPWWLIFSSGSLGGLLWTGLLVAGTLAMLWFGMLPRVGARSATMLQIIADIALLCVILAYVLTGTLIRDVIFRRKGGTMLVGTVAVLLMAVGSLTPMLICFFHNPQGFLVTAPMPWRVLNPLAALAPSSQRSRYPIFAIVWCSVMILLNMPWAWRQVRSCHPPAGGVEPG